MKILLAYASVTGNTYALASEIRRNFIARGCEVDFIDVMVNSYHPLYGYDAIIIGTYTWGKGEIPESMHELYEDMEAHSNLNMITGIFGTGDQSFGENYCGAVEQFTSMLNVRTNLVVRLKAEQYPSQEKLQKCSLFVERILEKAAIYM